MAPWGALGGGGFKTKEQRESGEGRKNFVRVAFTGKEEKVSLVLEEIAKKKGTLITSVALAYIMHKVRKSGQNMVKYHSNRPTRVPMSIPL